MKIYLLCMCLMASTCMAQTTGTVTAGVNLPLVALLDIEPVGGITLAFTAPSEAGAILGSSATDNTKWINVSSAVSSGLTRRITARISSTLPSGFQLRVQAANASTGAGTRGTSSGAVLLTNVDQTIVNGIAGAYTLSGSGNGYNLTYSLSIQSYSLLKSGTSTVTVVYTLQDN